MALAFPVLVLFWYSTLKSHLVVDRLSGEVQEVFQTPPRKRSTLGTEGSFQTLQE